VSEQQACRVTVALHATPQPRKGDRDDALRARLRDLSREHPRWGYRRAWASLRSEGWASNRKKIQRLWREEGLRVPAKRRKRQRLGISTSPSARLLAERPDQVWALDFQFDTTTDGRILKLLHVVDEHTREAWRSTRATHRRHTVRVLRRRRAAAVA
jgi:transposase InsO family protein